MFKQAISKLEEEGKGGKLFKSHLNTSTLMKANLLKPTILIINCHGEKDSATGKTSFCFEKQDRPTLIENMGEENLVILLQKD